MFNNTQLFILTPKKSDEIISEIKATSLSEAIKMFSIIKQMQPHKLLEIYSVYEKSQNGKRSAKKRP